MKKIMFLFPRRRRHELIELDAPGGRWVRFLLDARAVGHDRYLQALEEFRFRVRQLEDGGETLGGVVVQARRVDQALALDLDKVLADHPL